MSNFEITIRIPDLAAALEKLAAAITGKQATVQEVTSQEVTSLPAPAPRPQPVPAPTTPTTIPVYTPQQQYAQTTQPYTPPAQQPPAPTYTPQVAPVQPAPQQTAPTTQAPAYTLDDLAKAASALMDAGKQQQLLTLINQQFGVPSLMQLPKEQYGNFATALRQLGAKL